MALVLKNQQNVARCLELLLKLMLSALAVSNYRSLRDFVVSLRRLNVVTGANGSGKSNLYRALRLLAEIAQRDIAMGRSPA